MKIYNQDGVYFLVYKTDVYRVECFSISPFKRFAHGRMRDIKKTYGKRVKLSSLPDEAKEYALQFLYLPNFRLPKVSTKYGAPMGRSNTAKGKCKLGCIFVRDGYDSGGAYWGIGETLYCAKSKKSASDFFMRDVDAPGFSFVRAKSAFEAVKQFENMGLTF